MKKVKSEKMTIDKLAAMMQKSFLATDTNIADGFTKVNDRLGAVESRLTLIEQEIINVKDLPRRVKKLEEALEIE